MLNKKRCLLVLPIFIALLCLLSVTVLPIWNISGKPATDILAERVSISSMINQAKPLAKKAVKSVLTTVNPELRARREEEIVMMQSFHLYSYGPDEKQIFYLSYPKEQPSTTEKLAVIVHGGNFLSGSASDEYLYPLAKFFWDRGYAVASMDFRPLTEAKWPTPLEDLSKGIHEVHKVMGNNVKETVFVGFSAGAVSGMLLIYSDHFPDVSQVDKFIGISGLYSFRAAGTEAIETIQERSLDNVNLLEAVPKLRHPKTATPALLIEGSEDYFADKYPYTPKSHASRLQKTLKKHNVDAQTFWVTREGFTRHGGPLRLIELEDPEITKVIESFLES